MNGVRRNISQMCLRGALIIFKLHNCGCQGEKGGGDSLWKFCLRLGHVEGGKWQKPSCWSCYSKKVYRSRSHLLDLLLGVRLKKLSCFCFLLCHLQVTTWTKPAFYFCLCSFSVHKNRVFLGLNCFHKTIHSWNFSMTNASPKDTFVESFVALNSLPSFFSLFFFTPQ